MEQLLKNKVALIYGAGPIGGAVAKAFAREGAKVFLAAHSQGNLKKLAGIISKAGGVVKTAEVEVLDKESVHAFVDSVAAKTGRIENPCKHFKK